MREYFVYILASRSRRCIYIGVTCDLQRRVWQHRKGAVPGFTRDYRVTDLMYFEQTSDVNVAIAREKQLKRWPRERKNRLIEANNPGWRDLAIDWTDHEPPNAPATST